MLVLRLSCAQHHKLQRQVTQLGSDFRQQINAGDYDYLITSQYSWDTIDSIYAYPYLDWIKGERALKQVLQEDVSPQPDYVFKVRGRLDPATCPRS